MNSTMGSQEISIYSIKTKEYRGINIGVGCIVSAGEFISRKHQESP